jgi:LacI family transcriptional regulator, galactose operon repressor
MARAAWTANRSQFETFTRARISGVTDESNQPSLKEVAQIVGVSVGTISNYLNHPEKVAEETRKGISEAIEGSGWVPNISGRILRQGRSTLVGLVVLDVTNPFFTAVARGVEDAADESGYNIVLCNTDGLRETEERYLWVLEEHRAAGVVITPAHGDESSLEWLRERGMKVVLLDKARTLPNISSVSVDDVEGGRLAGAHLLGLGHKRIGFVTGPLLLQQCVDRREGLHTAVNEAGLEASSALVEIEVPGMRVADGENAARQLLESSIHPSAVFCANDLLAVGVLRVLRDEGLRVPQDVALVGYDDVEYSALLEPSLTTIHQPKYELGYSAMELLLREIEGSSEFTQTIYTPTLEVRESTLQ